MCCTYTRICQPAVMVSHKDALIMLAEAVFITNRKMRTSAKTINTNKQTLLQT